MDLFVRSSLVALLVGTVAAPLAAQDIRPLSSGPERSGFWWGIGLGAAKVKIKCSGCISFNTETFPMLDLHLGGTLSPHVTLGAQLSGGRKRGAFFSPSDSNTYIGDLNVSAYYYPNASGNLWLQGGLATVVWEKKAGSVTYHSVGNGLVLGAGYDLRSGRKVSITPSIRGVIGGKANAKDQDGNLAAVDFQTTYLHFGVSILWH